MDFSLFSALKADAWLTIAILVVMFILLARTKIQAEFIYMGAMACLFITGVLDARKTFSSFTAISVVTLATLCIVTSGVVHSGALSWIIDKTLGKPKRYTTALIRMMLTAAMCSTFVFDSVATTTMMRKIKGWAKSLSLAPSKLLLPLSFAATLGGMCTMIGSPSNILIYSLLYHYQDLQNHVFTPLVPGLCCLVAGILVILLTRRLLPDRRTARDILEEIGEYTVEFLVPETSDLVGKKVGESNVLFVNGGRLIEIMRGEEMEIICPVSPDETIHVGDRLIYAGQADVIMDIRNDHELTLAQPILSTNDPKQGHQFYMASLQHDSLLVGETMESCDFEEVQNAVLVAVVREGELVDENPCKIKLTHQDVLLLEGSPTRKRVLEKTASRDLVFLEEHEKPKKTFRIALAIGIVAMMVALEQFGSMILLQAAFLAAVLMLITRCCSTTQAWYSFNWNTILVFASSVAFAFAIQKTAISYVLAKCIVDLCDANPILSLICLCLMASIATEFAASTLIAAIFYPVAMATALTLSVSFLPFVIALMIACSSNFISPLSSPSNKLVYGEGGYRTLDYLPVGILMKVVVLAVEVTAILLFFDI